MITNGTVKYGETVKTGDYENKRVDVELSFTLAEGEDADVAMADVGISARHQAVLMLTGCKTAPKPATEPAAKTEEKPTVKAAAKAPKVPAAKAVETVAVADPSIVEETPVPAYLKEKMLDPATGKAGTKAAVVDPAAVVDGGIDDLFGTGEPAKEITDKEITDATQKCQQQNKNSLSIRKLITELAGPPPKRIIDIPQDKRQKFLDELLKVQPLA